MPRLLWPSWRSITISHAFARHLDGVRVPQLVRHKAPANACRDGRPAEVGAGGGAGPAAAACRAGENADQRPDGKLDSRLEPWLQLGPAPRVHAGLAARSTLAAMDQQRAAALIEIRLGEGERLLDAQPRTPEDPEQAAQPAAVAAVASGAADGDNSSTLGGSAG
jgi:hypothetical protein